MLEQIEFKRAVPPTPPSQRTVLQSKNSDLSSGEVNTIIRSTNLVQQQWFPYHAKAVRKLGAQRYLDLADDSKLGSDPRTLFSWLLKEELLK